VTREIGIKSITRWPVGHEQKSLRQYIFPARAVEQPVLKIWLVVGWFEQQRGHGELIQVINAYCNIFV